MSTRLEGLLDRTLKLAQELCGGVVTGAVEGAKQVVVKNAVPLVIGATGIVLALVFGAIGFNRWLETIIDADHRWASPIIVALVCGLVGLTTLRSARGRP